MSTKRSERNTNTENVYLDPIDPELTGLGLFMSVRLPDMELVARLKDFIASLLGSHLFFLHDGVDRYMTKILLHWIINYNDQYINPLNPLHNIYIINFSAAGSVHTEWQCELMV